MSEPAPQQGPHRDNAPPPPPPPRRRCGVGFFWGLIVMLVIVILVPIIIAAIGFINVGADQSLGPIDSFLGFASERSVDFHAANETNPHANDPAAVADALPHYREMCFVCHGAPGVKPSEIAAGMHPAPPDLASDDTQAMTDGQLYWVIAHGIGSTGMPAFKDADDADTRWKIVSFLRHLPKLTPAELTQLQHPADESESDHKSPPKPAP